MSAQDSGATPEVAALIARALPTMVHVELLLLLQRTAPTAWSVAAASEELRGSTALIEAAMAELALVQLAAPVQGAIPPAWRLDVSDEPSVAALLHLRELYERRPVTLVRALYERSSSLPPDVQPRRPTSE